MENTSQKNRRILAVLAVVVGVFMIAVAPFLIQTSVERVVTALQVVAQNKPAYASGITLFAILYPLYRGLIFIGGITLLLIARSLDQGKGWTFPVAALASAFPAAGGMFMVMPYVSFIDGLPLPMVVSAVGLAFFWSLILLRNVDRPLKWGQFWTMTFAGMLTTHALVTGTGNLRMLFTTPDRPVFHGLGTWVLSWSAPIQWICAVLLFIAIYKIAAEKYSGWWLALISAASLVAIDVPMQYFRMTLAGSTSWDYMYGLPIIVGLLVALLLPKYRSALRRNEPGRTGPVAIVADEEVEVVLD